MTDRINRIFSLVESLVKGLNQYVELIQTKQNYFHVSRKP